MEEQFIKKQNLNLKSTGSVTNPFKIAYYFFGYITLTLNTFIVYLVLRYGADYVNKIFLVCVIILEIFLPISLFFRRKIQNVKYLKFVVLVIFIASLIGVSLFIYSYATFKIHF